MSGDAATSRRGFLRAAGASLTVGFMAGCTLPVIPKRPVPALEDAVGWVRHQDGRYLLLLPRVEMGQQILTALKQIACDELNIPWSALEARLPDTTAIGRVRATVGSESIKAFALPLAQACASLREALAAGVRSGTLQAQPRPAAELRSLRRLGAEPTRRFVGRAVPLEQAPAIVRGEALYVADVRRDGMVYGRVLRAPASPELASQLLGADEAAARRVPGFVALVRDPLLTAGRADGLGIVARTPGALDRIERVLAARWQIDGAFDAAQVDAAIDIDRQLASSPDGAHAVHADRLDPEGRWDLDLRIDVPLAAHAAIEPRAAVAEFGADGTLRMWVGSQDVFYQRDVLARRLGLDEARVVVQGCRVGGAFGGKTISTVELEAAVLARACALPVKVQWTREQEFRLGFHRPPSSHRLRARLSQGRLQDWSHRFSTSHILLTNAAAPPWLQRVSMFIGDDGAARGAPLPYRAVRRRSSFDLVRLPVFTGPWRGLGAGPNGLAIESAIDECARLAGADPLRFRLDHAQDPRLARVLRRVADAARWGHETPARPGVKAGRGIACGIYKQDSYAAVVADVEVPADGSAPRVTHLWCAHDCGLVINPDQVRAQCEGNLVWGLGMVLVERLPLGRSQVAAANFADSPIPRMDQVPPMQIVLVDEGDPPSGAGETAIVAAGAAIANAVRDASGVRPLRFPIQIQP